MNILTNIIGYTATFTGMFLMLPQVARSFRTKKAGDVSMVMVLMYISNSVLWFAYGLLIFAPPVFIANAVALVISVVQLVLKLKYKS